MSQDNETLQLQKELQQNPRSVQFTKLAEIYLSRDMVEEAFALVKQSLKFHPRSVSGLILLGRINKLKKQYFESLAPLIEASKLAHDNWRAWLELAESYVELKNGKQALTSFKRVLLFNPSHPMARRAVAKLELLTADEYEDDLFQMQKLPDAQLQAPQQPQKAGVSTSELPVAAAHSAATRATSPSPGSRPRAATTTPSVNRVAPCSTAMRSGA